MTDPGAQALAGAMARCFTQWLEGQGLMTDGRTSLSGQEVLRLTEAYGEGFSRGAIVILRSGLGRCSACDAPQGDLLWP